MGLPRRERRRSVGQHAEHGHKQDTGCRTERIFRNSVHEIIQPLHQTTTRERKMERRAKNILVEKIEQEAKIFKAKKAPGSSGITIETIRIMDSVNLKK